MNLTKTSQEAQYSRLFSALPAVEACSDFDSKVCSYVRLKRIRSIKMHLFGLSAVALSSCTAAVYAVTIFIRSFFESGFSDYLSLLLSADSSLATYWKEITYSLVESVPLGALVFVLATATLFLWSLSRVTKDAGDISSVRMAPRQA